MTTLSLRGSRFNVVILLFSVLYRPLHDAVENGHVEVVRLLLSYGADASLSTSTGLTPLELARSPVMVELLRGRPLSTSALLLSALVGYRTQNLLRLAHLIRRCLSTSLFVCFLGFLSDMAGESIDGSPVLPWHFPGTVSFMGERLTVLPVTRTFLSHLRYQWGVLDECTQW